MMMRGEDYVDLIKQGLIDGDLDKHDVFASVLHGLKIVHESIEDGELKSNVSQTAFNIIALKQFMELEEGK